LRSGRGRRRRRRRRRRRIAGSEWLKFLAGVGELLR
jgi:hypothetical protein